MKKLFIQSKFLRKKWFPFYLLLCFLILSFLCFLISDLLLPLPQPYLTPQDTFSRVVVAQDGTPLRAFADKQGVWRYPVSIDQVSPLYINTLLHYEDRWFWQHPGINPLALLRATQQNLWNNHIVSGGSTLTMQVARLIDPHKRTLRGKAKQMFRALQLEWHYSKSEILTFYLNLAPFGGPLEGVQAASFAYLGKSAQELSLAEAALLTVLPQAPSRFRPDRHPQKATQARNKVLHRLYNLGVISQEEEEDAQLEIVVPQLEAHPMIAPILARRLKNKQPNKMIIHSTIDAPLQSNLEALVKNYSQRLSKKSSIAVLVVNHHTMAVKAYIASAGFNNQLAYGQVDMIRAIRSPGSTLKPFLYAMALDQGLVSSHSMLMDKKLNFSGYKPENFSKNFSGVVTMSEALQRSLNVPAVQVLQFVGVGLFHAKLENAGLILHLPAHSSPGLAMILGGTGTRLEELVAAYTAFSRAGKVGKLRFNPDDPIQEKPLFSAGAAWIVRDILSYLPSSQRFSGMIKQRPSNSRLLYAWKTGTSYGFRDAWAIGMTSDYTIGIWTGRPDGTPVPGHYGAQSAVPLLKSVSHNLPLIHNKSIFKNQPPKSVTQKVICWPEGALLSDTKPDQCQKKYLSWLLNDTAPPMLAVNPQLEAVFETLKIISIEDNSKIKRPQGSDDPLVINLQAQGGQGDLFWFINGVPVNKHSTRAMLSYTFLKSGQYQISVIDEQGQNHKVNIEVQ